MSGATSASSPVESEALEAPQGRDQGAATAAARARRHPLASRALRRALWREHRVLVLIILAYVVGSALLGGAIGWQAPDRGLIGYLGSLYLPLTIGVVALFPTRLRMEREGVTGMWGGWAAAWRAKRATDWTDERLYGACIVMGLFPLFAATFTSWKQSIPLLVGYPWDPALAAADRWLLGGRDAWRLTHAVLGWGWITRIMDALYLPTWVVQQMTVLTLAAMAPPGALRRRYLMSYVTTWIGAGTLTALAFASAGPCFMGILTGTTGDASHFAPLMQKLAAMHHTFPLVTYRGQDILLGALFSGGLMPGGGISAFPSLHVANTVLIAIAARHVSRRWAKIFAAYAVIIFVGSVHFGFHYVVDGIAGAAIAAIVWWTLGKVVRDRTPALAVDRTP